MLSRLPPVGQDAGDHFCYSVIGDQPDGYGLLPYNLNMKVFVEAPRTFADTLVVDTPTTHTERTLYQCQVMDDDAKNRFFNAFRDAVHECWNNKLWLATRRRTRRRIPGLRCGVNLIRTTSAAEAHLRIKVLYRYTAPSNAHPETREFRAFCDRVGGTANRGRADIVIDYPARPGNAETGQASDFHTTRNLPTSNHGGATFTQNTVGHEFGHYLGLAHTCAGEGRANGDAEYCDGRSRGRQRHIMAVGNIIHAAHADPWLQRLQRHHHYCELAWRPHTHRERPPR